MSTEKKLEELLELYGQKRKEIDEIAGELASLKQKIEFDQLVSKADTKEKVDDPKAFSIEEAYNRCFPLKVKGIEDNSREFLDKDRMKSLWDKSHQKCKEVDSSLVLKIFSEVQWLFPVEKPHSLQTDKEGEGYNFRRASYGTEEDNQEENQEDYSYDLSKVFLSKDFE